MTTEPSAVTVTQFGRQYGQVVRIGHHVLSADEPQSAGGQDIGPSTYEYVLAGLGACTSITARMYADRHQWKLRGMTVELQHEKVTGPDGSSTIDRFLRTIVFEGELTEEQRKRLFQVIEQCPVSQTLRRSAHVDSKLADARLPSTA